MADVPDVVLDPTVVDGDPDHAGLHADVNAQVNQLTEAWNNRAEDDGLLAAIAGQARGKAAAPIRLRPVTLDRFADSNAWSFWQAGGAAGDPWTIDAGVMTSPGTDPDHSFAVRNGLLMGDGIVRVALTNLERNLGSPGNDWAGLFLANGADNYLTFLVYNKAASEGGRRYAIYRIESGSFIPLVAATETTDVIHADIDVPLSAEWERKGTLLTARLNGKAVWSANLSTADSGNDLYRNAGQVGLVAVGSQTFGFSNFTVSEHLWDAVPPTITSALVLGTSISNGIGASSTPNAYRNVLATLLNADYTNGLTVHNGGQNGDTSAGMLSRVAALIGTHDPEVVFIETPVNDFRDTLGYSPAQTAANLTKIAKYVKAQGKIPVLMTATPVNPTQTEISLGPGTDWSVATGLQKLGEANHYTRELAAAEKVILVDLFHAFGGDASATYLNDGLHPNNAGHALMAQAIHDVITGLRAY